MKIGYARVSTFEQSLDLQIDDLKNEGCDHIFTDKISGSKSDRPGLNKMLEMLRTGDTVIVWRFDRLGRNLKHLLILVDDFKQKGVQLKSIREHIDTNSANGQFFFHMIATMCEFEREIIRERTLAGLATARSRGRFGGRRVKFNADKQAIVCELYNSKNFTLNKISEMMGISVPTIYSYLRKDKPIPQ